MAPGVGERLMRAPSLLFCLAAMAGAVGCGSDSPDDRGSFDGASRLVDPDQTPPIVNSLERTGDGTFLLTTNKGFWRISPDGKRLSQVRDATAVAREGTSPVGNFLEVADIGTDDLLGSGHPDDPQALPQYLGIMRSSDGGKTWNVLSRLGTADVHHIVRNGSTVYLWDAVLGAVLVSEDGLRSFAERFTPRSQVLDMVVDPKDADYLLISTQEELYRSEDQGKRWRPSGLVSGTRLAWAETGELYRASEDGSFEQSSDRGRTWRRIGRLPGPPEQIELRDARSMWVAMSDGSIAETTDGGRRWRVLFKAPSAEG